MANISLSLRVTTLASETLPLLAVTFITENSLVAAVRKEGGSSQLKQVSPRAQRCPGSYIHLFPTSLPPTFLPCFLPSFLSSMHPFIYRSVLIRIGCIMLW